MKKITRLTLACALMCSGLFISSQPALSQDEDLDLDLVPEASGGGNAATTQQGTADAAQTQEAAVACGAIIAKLRGQDNRNPADNKSEKSIVPGNWSKSCANSKVSYDSCSLTAQCAAGNDNALQPATTINLGGCVDKEVKSSGGNLICN